MFEAPTPDASRSTHLARPQLARPKRKSILPRGYLAFWSALACVASAYVIEVSLETIDLPRLLAHVPKPAAPSVATDAAIREANRLRETLAEFQHDLGQARTELAARIQDPSAIASLAAIEERMSITTGVPLAPPATAPVTAANPPEPAPTTVALAPVAAPARPAEAATAPVAAAVPVIVEAPAPANPPPHPIALAPPMLEQLVTPIETGSITPPAKLGGHAPKAAPGVAAAQPAPQPVIDAAQLATSAIATPATEPQPAEPILFGPAIVKPAPKPFAVQLASGPTLDAIRLSWSMLSEQHAAALGKLQPHFTSTGTPATGQIFDLIAGPVKSAADAKKLCKALATRGTDCKVAPYAGEAL